MGAFRGAPDSHLKRPCKRAGADSARATAARGPTLPYVCVRVRSAPRNPLRNRACGRCSLPPQTLPSWRHSIWVGVWDPWIVVSKPHLWYKARICHALRRVETRSAHRAPGFLLPAGDKLSNVSSSPPQTARDTVCIEMMHRAFERGLMEYGMMRGVKKA